MSAASAFTYTVNAVMGSGALALPYAVQHSGYILGPILLILMGFLAYVTLAWHFEVQLRAIALIDAFNDRTIFLAGSGEGADAAGEIAIPESSIASDSTMGSKAAVNDAGGSGTKVLVSKSYIQEHDAASAEEGQKLIQGQSLLATVSTITSKGMSWTLKSRLMPDQEYGEVHYDSYPSSAYAEIGVMLQLFCGRWAAMSWNILVVVYVLLSLWSYTVVWTTTATIGIPVAGVTTYLECLSSPDATQCDNAQRIYVAVFAVLAFIMMMRDWSFMSYVQKFLTGLMYTCLTLIIVTILVAMFQQPFSGAPTTQAPSNATSSAAVTTTTSGSAPSPQPSLASRGFSGQEAYLGPGVVPFDGAHFSTIFGATIFAMLCHSASTLILQQMPSKQVTKRIYMAAFVCITFVYVAMSLVVALYLGDDVDSLVTHNWANYYLWGTPKLAPLGDFLGGVILFYPMISVTATFYVLARALANSIEEMLPLPWKQTIAEKLSCCGGSGQYKPGQVGIVQVLIRESLVVFPVVVALISKSYHQAVSFAGLVGFGVLFFYPVALQFMSHRVLKSVNMPSRTPHDDWLSHPWIAAVLGVVAFGLCIYYIIGQIVPMF